MTLAVNWHPDAICMCHGAGTAATCAEGIRPLYYGKTALNPQSGITAQQGVVTKHRSLSGGAIAGIVIGGVVFLVLCAAAAYYIVKRHAAMKVRSCRC